MNLEKAGDKSWTHIKSLSWQTSTVRPRNRSEAPKCCLNPGYLHWGMLGREKQEIRSTRISRKRKPPYDQFEQELLETSQELKAAAVKIEERKAEIARMEELERKAREERHKRGG